MGLSFPIKLHVQPLGQGTVNEISIEQDHIPNTSFHLHRDHIVGRAIEEHLHDPLVL